MFKIIQLGRFLGEVLGRFAGPLMKVDVFCVKSLLGLLPSVAPASTIDGAIQEKSVEKKSCKRKKRNHWSHLKEMVG